jgi:hypothetical protein
MPELGQSGSVRGASRNGRPYRDSARIMHRCSNFGSICGVDRHFRSSLGAAGQLQRAAEVREENFTG